MYQLLRPRISWPLTAAQYLGTRPTRQFPRAEKERIGGTRARLQSAVAESGGQIAETELKIIQVDRALASEVAGELRKIKGELGERKVAAKEQLRRIEIRAPRDGVVHQSIVYTVGGLVGEGETLMHIVPQANKLTVEARVSPRDIDHLHEGQAATLRFTSFNVRTPPDVNGTLSRISADVSFDENLKQSYYTVRIAMSEDGVAQLGDVTLVPGMPVETFIKTGDRSVIFYLVKPLSA